MTDDFDPSQFNDQYREALEEVINAKIEGREVVAPAEPQAKGEVVDLMAALKASVESARKGQPVSAAPTGRTAARKSAGKKSTSAKSAGSTKRAQPSKAVGKTASKAAGRSASKSTRGRTKKSA
jgi:DNA end-binding protein Ku